MEASGTVAKDQEVEFKALEGSLSMMSKGACFALQGNCGALFDNLLASEVLNDVLDL